MRALLAFAALMLIGAAAPTAAGPSFSCEGALSASEAAICSDPELAAWDRAVAQLYPFQRSQGAVTPAEQREWLTRRDRCGSDRLCLRSAVMDWPGFPAPSGYGSRFDRRSGRDFASLEVAALGGGWYVFSVTAIHIVLDSKGREVTANTGDAYGVFRLIAGNARFDSDPSQQMACKVDFSRQGLGWRLADNGQCGGLNVTLSGHYQQSRKYKRR